MPDVLLIGLGPTAQSALDGLVGKVNLLGLVRDATGGAEAPDPVVVRARALGVPVFQDASPADIEDLVSGLRPDCVVVSSYNRIIGPALLARCPFLNVHYAPLPRYRGRANVNWALVNDEGFTAITVHVMVPELDAGAILFQRVIPIGETETVEDLYARLNALQQEHLAETVLRFVSGETGAPQSQVEATYGCTRVPADGEIDWTASTRTVHRLVRALAPPFPGAVTYFEGRRLLVWKAEPVVRPPVYRGRIPGRVVGISKSDGYVDVLTGDGVLRLLEVQAEGGSRVAPAEIIRSLRGTLGLRTSQLLERIEALERQIKHLIETHSASR